MPNEEDVKALAEDYKGMIVTVQYHTCEITGDNEVGNIQIHTRPGVLTEESREALARRALEFAEERLQEFFKRDHEDHIKQLKALKELQARIESLRFGH